MEKNEKRSNTVAIIAIIIAVLAIIAAILIPVISAAINKGYNAYYVGLVSEFNKALALDAEVTGADSYQTAFDAIQACERSGGFVVPRIVGNLDCNIAWDSAEQQFVLLDTENQKCIYPETADSIKTTDISGNKARFFVIADSKATAPSGYSIYAGENWQDKTVTLSGESFDAGTSTNIQSVTYTNSADTNTAIIRTNNYDTVLTINADNATVKHYGKANRVNVNAVAMQSYHEFGDVAGNINLTKGNVVVEQGGSASAIIIDLTAAELATVTNVSADNTKATYVPIILNTTKEDWGSNTNKGLIDPETNNIIYTIPGTSSTVIDNEGQTVTEETNAVCYNKTTGVYYLGLDKALDESEDNQTIILLQDTVIFEEANRDDCPAVEKKGLTLNLNGHNLKWPYSVWLQSAENLTIENGSMSGVSEGQSYCCFFGDEDNTSVTLSNLTCTGGFNFYNTTATISTCNVTINAGYNTIWADENSNVTVLSGMFDASGRTVGKGVFGCDKDAKLTIKGGTFISNDTDILLTTTEKSSTGEYEADSNGISILGGAFNVNVTDFTFKKLVQSPDTYETTEHYTMLRSGYTAEQKDGLWVVSAK